MKNEFALAFNEVLEEKQLPKEIILDALNAAMVSAYRRAVNASNAQHVEATIDPDTGKITIYAEKEVVESVEDPRTEVILSEALRYNPETALGEMVIVESTPRNFGRVAAQTARQVIQQRMREAERDVQLNHFTKQVGEIISGVVQAVNPQAVTLGMDMKAEGLMPRNQQIPGERFHVHDRVRALLLEVKTSPRGPQIILSRAHRNFLRRLLENEVPEIYHGMVEIRSIAREPGQRSKVAVAALQAGVDPVGACVGIRGVRIQAIVRELNDEKIDVIEWNADPAAFIAKALSPARVSGVYLNDTAKGAKTATVVVPEDQLSLAIGRDGQNARLAAKLTSWRIDIKSLPEAASDALYKLQHEAVYAFLLAGEEANLPALEAVLAKKAEGRPVTPEEYQILSQFVERVERGLLKQRQSDKKAEEERLLLAKADVPAPAFEMPLADFPLSDRVFNVISEAGYQSVGDLMLQMRLDSDEILKLAGMGPKGMAELEEAIAQLSFEDEAVVEETVTEVEPEAVAEMEAAPAEVETEPEAEVTIAESEAPVAALEEAAEAEAALAAIPESVIPEVETTEEDAPLTPAEAEAEMEALFALRAEELAAATGDEEEEDDDDDKKKKKKKKKKYVEVEYDPEADVVIAKKKRKRGGEWDQQF